MPLIMIIAVVLLWMQGSDEIRGYMEATNTVKGDYLTAKTNRQPFQFPEVTKSVDR